MRSKIVIISLFGIFFSSNIFAQYPAGVEPVLKEAGKNRSELEKVIQHYSKSAADSLKLKAAFFLIANMDIHYSADYYWADSTGKRIPYNETDYPDFVSAVKAFDEIKSVYGKVKPVPFTYKDIDTVKAAFLIENIEKSFDSWKLPHAKKLSFEDFCEYILPYRVSTEPLQDWREAYHRKFEWIQDSAAGKGTEEALHYLAADFKSWFTNTWDLEQRKEPLPRLGPLQLLSRKKGNCDDIGDLQVYTLRSQGYPAVLEYIPYWATTTGRHFFNSTWDENGKHIPFDVSTANIKIDNFSREPSKVIRITYARQQDVLANIVPVASIPPGFLRMLNYKDVTPDYWQTSNISLKLFNLSERPAISYACVFNGFKWSPTWWGYVNGDSATFKNMCKGAVFLPMYYIKGKLVPAGYPVASGYNHKLVLKPDMLNKHEIRIQQQDKYLIFRPGKNYKLYYWNNGWKLQGQQLAGENIPELVFKDVPGNALMLLVPEYSQGKERPFIITNDGERLWW